MATTLYLLGVAAVAIVLYVRKINRLMSSQPPQALATSHRWTDEEIRKAFEKCSTSPIVVKNHLPPKTGHRYIVVGGNGFVGGWIVLQLLERGEPASNIRILDIRPPERYDLLTGEANKVDFVKVDVTDREQVKSAFSKPWSIAEGASGSSPLPPLTVIHTAVVIRVWERNDASLHRSTKVNVTGTQNVLDAATEAGASYFIFTSSGSILSPRMQFLVAPWAKLSSVFVQFVNDNTIPVSGEQRIANYCWSKRQAEMLVLASDGRATPIGRMRTGCLRPGSMIYGPGGDPVCEAMLRRKTTPSPLHSVMQSNIYVENAALAHLALEAALITNPDHTTSDRPYLVTDPNPAVASSDYYRAMTLLTNGEVQFPEIPPFAVLPLAYTIAFYYVTRDTILANFPWARHILPALKEPIVMMQPPIFSTSMIHLFFDDGRARLPVSEGGIGYNPPYTTLDGFCKLVHGFEHREKANKEAHLGRGIRPIG